MKYKIIIVIDTFTFVVGKERAEARNNKFCLACFPAAIVTGDIHQFRASNIFHLERIEWLLHILYGSDFKQ